MVSEQPDTNTLESIAALEVGDHADVLTSEGTLSVYVEATDTRQDSLTQTATTTIDFRTLDGREFRIVLKFYGNTEDTELAYAILNPRGIASWEYVTIYSVEEQIQQTLVTDGGESDGE